MYCSLTDVFFTQVMMMVLPLLIIVLLPKVVNTNDPEMRRVSNLTLALCIQTGQAVISEI